MFAAVVMFACNSTAFWHVHEHMFTCHKPPNGFEYCRLAFPRDLIERTKPVELVKSSIDLNVPETYENIDNASQRPKCSAEYADDTLACTDSGLAVPRR